MNLLWILLMRWKLWSSSSFIFLLCFIIQWTVQIILSCCLHSCGLDRIFNLFGLMIWLIRIVLFITVFSLIFIPFSSLWKGYASINLPKPSISILMFYFGFTFGIGGWLGQPNSIAIVEQKNSGYLCWCSDIGLVRIL